MGNVTKGATPGTYVAHDHKCGSTVAKALPEIRATSFFANCMEIVLPQNVFEPYYFRSARELRPNPRWFR